MMKKKDLPIPVSKLLLPCHRVSVGEICPVPRAGLCPNCEHNYTVIKTLRTVSEFVSHVDCIRLRLWADVLEGEM